jgi:YidC/Oxa1 family membrane protein insertase
VSIPLMILAGIATYFNSRASIARQSPEAAANPQTALMNKLALYVFPLGVVVGGPFLPIAIIIYWVANNIWTFGQQHLVFGKIEKEEEAAKQDAIARRSANAPAPGVKPTKARKVAASDVADGVPGDDAPAESNGAADGDNKSATNGAGPANLAPRPGARPAARPKKRKR